MKKNKNNGITLVALVITIIILLILAGISIHALTQTNLFDKTRQAKNAMENAQNVENETLASYSDKVNEYLPGENVTGETLASKVKVGDYVSYTPDELDNAALATLKSNLNTYSGASSSTINTTIQRDSLEWRVLDTTENGQVRLISAEPTTSRIELCGYNGYNNAVKLLDDACSTLYNNSKLASKVQNLKIEDITHYMKSKPTENTRVCTPTDINYPKILEKEENQTIEKSSATDKLGLSEQTEFVTGKDTSGTSSLKHTMVDDYLSMNSDTFSDPKYYELFAFSNDRENAHWMSSRCVASYGDSAMFCVRQVRDNDIIRFWIVL